MIGRPNFRQRDIEWGRAEGRAKARAERTAQEMSAVKRMLQDGKINQEQLEDFLKYIKEEEAKKEPKSSVQS